MDRGGKKIRDPRRTDRRDGHEGREEQPRESVATVIAIYLFTHYNEQNLYVLEIME